MNEMSVTDLSKATSPTVIDVREPDEFSGGHVPGAVNIPLGTLEGADLPEGPLAVICQSGGRSARATDFLTSKGVDATNVTGGTSAWMEAGFPVDTGSVS